MWLTIDRSGDCWLRVALHTRVEQARNDDDDDDDDDDTV